MSILIFNRLPYYDAPYEKWLEDLNEDLFLLTSDQLGKDFHGFKQVFAFDRYDFNNSVEFTALQLYKQSPYRRVIATAERDILRAAYVRHYFGLEGQSLQSAIAFRDKVKMKEILSAARIRVPAFQRVDSVVDLYEFIEEQGYPVVVKPVDGMGSRNTTVLDSDQDTMEYLAHGLSPHLEVEEYIEGEMYHIDGLVLNGQIKLIWPSKYLNHCLAFQEGKYLGSYLLSPENPLTARLQSYVSSVLRTLPTPTHTTFHAEVFHTPQDELVLCEIACRTGGSRICEEYRQAFDVDLTKLSIQAQCGLSVDVPERVARREGPKTQFGFIGIPPKHGVFRLAPRREDFPDWVTEYRVLARPGQYFTGAHTSVDYAITLVVCGDSEAQVYSRLEESARLVEQKWVWN
ncbi:MULTISPECIES: acetyl-CoA carboxylase biotin carboxylase subunit family protein [Thermoactinomyces]|uniref:ATP-grasp domain-containing protein n=1 Tax=Thermoactinomyces daqus TaxID=1329516 RepID=A0A7W2AI84_9BACL|nr:MULTISPECIES: ATP-grasp domain-containing protein [Thermoactinomyces]MBA4542593.1 ATP-grasp domain-containing protein [Thermoactinomyces daqus]MBH8598007.1 ATP-grasp domain-containing protein [Thermoactinomyces sp. CICC 10523]MBH8603038.1 ATP-grasp domain-containing protein [Thermoactinomyces sp. CICC 10522]MBH8609247.1 ATP-grasp domain-containing protein [Thermoactinomyces sp. CICC 10521]